MQALKQGESSALEPIYNGTKKAVFAVCYSYLKDYARAEDLMQDTYVCVKRFIGGYRENTNPQAWILAIAKNLCLNELKKRGREIFVDFFERPDLVPDETEIAVRDETGIIRLAEKHLDENEFKIVMMHTIGGVTLAEIAQVFGKPQGTVRWQYNNALKKLRKIIKKEGLCV